MEVKKIITPGNDRDLIILGDSKSSFRKFGFSKTELDFIKTQISRKKEIISINQYSRLIIIAVLLNHEKHTFEILEKCRKSASAINLIINEYKIENIFLVSLLENPEYLLSLAEGLALSNYQFLKYIKKPEEKKNSLEIINISGIIKAENISSLNILIKSVYFARDMINEPACYMNAVKLAETFKKLSKEAGFKIEIFNKSKIETLKFGGLLAVNKGSVDPPTFTIMEWHPENAKNKNPIVLVGKGVVYDTGGLSLKPTPDSMDYMKSDMSGAAAVGCTMYAIAKAKLPVYIVGLVPATDNRPGGNAYAPGDIISMHNGMSVEMLNADAEGRMILADALSYASKYNPELVIDIATLTGSASMAIGKYAMVGMGNADKKIFNKLVESGEVVNERIVEFPFWEEYNEQLKSDIADIKNVGGKEAGAITGGKFLEKFTGYPYIHLDIAGVAYAKTADSYRGKGGTGVGIRLFFDFILRNYSSRKKN